VTVTTILCCEIIPLSIAPIRGYRLRLCLFTTPGALYIEGNMERALHGADGVVFVTDSRRARHDTAIESMGALATYYVARQGRSLASVPLVLQYNMRDLPDILPVAELDAVLNPGGRPSFEAVAPMGQGVFETLKAVVKPIVESVRALH
jgi:signal recognition particle receptor subunit beta